MELRQLRYLIAIADEGQFTRAALRERVAQPALSQQIARLEAEVGTSLIRRSRRGSTLTQAGAALADRGRRMLAELEGAQAELAEIRGVRAGRITIGAMQTLGRFDLVGLLTTYRERYPDVELFVREALSGSLAEHVRLEKLDLSFLAAKGNVEGLEVLPVEEEELVAILPRSHPLAHRKRIRFSELAEEQFISFSEGSALRAILSEAAGEAGFLPRITVESNEIPRIGIMVERGLGIALMPRSAAQDLGRRVAVAPFVGRPWSWNVGLAWRRGRQLDPAATAFLELVRSSTDQAAPEQ